MTLGPVPQYVNVQSVQMLAPVSSPNTLSLAHIGTLADGLRAYVDS